MLLFLTCLLGFGDTPSWPQFRGEHALGLAEGAAPPVEFDLDSAQLRYRVRIPGLAHSSPVIHGDRLFLTSAIRVGEDAELSSLYGSEGYGSGDPVPSEGPHRFVVRCHDRRDGQLIWQRTLREAAPRFPRHPKSTHANATPCVDGKRLVVSFGSEGLFALDLDGQVLWQRDMGPLRVGAPGYHEDLPWGFASSPVLHEDRVYFQGDQEDQSFLACLDAVTGETLWRVDREENSTWCTPALVTQDDGQVQVICNGYKELAAYDAESGERLWFASGGGDVPVPTPIVDGSRIYLTSAHGRERPLRALPRDARGEIGSEDWDWVQPRMGIYMQTPLLAGGLIYACSDGGVLGVFEATNGKRVYRERLGDGTSGFSASAVSAEDRIYWADESGQVICVRAGKEFEVLGRTELGEPCLATPALVEGVLYVRGRDHLFALGD